RQDGSFATCRRSVQPPPLDFAAAERRKSVATAEGRGDEFGGAHKPRRASATARSLKKRAAKDSFAAPRLIALTHPEPRPSAVATLFRRSAAESGSFRIPRSGGLNLPPLRGSSRARHEDHGLQPWLHSLPLRG